ncbi:hypothetical protein JAO71_00310 [Olleya sp. YSTF-M6]|uniref:Blue (type 1) copper domain-containing protein n=1 Tax=Olleya sediminilitoris TaxID=2795739 RepID=A0ABS1WGI7_9FLAO|nr:MULTISPECIES: plastocyanin/azurin family copper-binding protein [Olleya]MBL7558226.1 hypothetical protein [Olleya sediminilitoris]
MKKLIATLVLTLTLLVSVNAQDKMMKNDTVKTVALEQTTGEFTQKGLTISEGTYVFEIANNAVGKDVGFVLIKKGADASNPENHIKTAYVTSVVKDGETQSSKATTLAKGEYTYFCPLNNTPQYTLTVQ